ncbi:hypothetical protein [Rubellicoccus peritrichatus]|uniref:Uncharacterized protein n=1 Tax=Rubellicoccus peritrichatus TaxID=3080537 RepID=A0AAQ3LB91_9BACT|nr:hypothetical protein [Puniceicoccus sp. CR14]WOO41349.1 hypothetical protein RZN69_22245 [Puniceicoccus sp. CR14]
MNKLIIPFLLLFCQLLPAAITNTLPYQGRVSEDNLLPTGPRHFKFAIVDDATSPTVSYWSNDGTSTSGSEPSIGHELQVTKGLFALELGEGGVSNIALPSDIWNNDILYLRVWYSEGGASGPFDLIESIRILPVAHAHRATIADSAAVATVATTANSLAVGVSIDDADADPNNELQMLTLNGSGLSIDDGNSNTGFSSVDLSSAVSSILDGSSGLGIGLNGNVPDAALQINGNTGYKVFQGLSNIAEIRNGSFMTGSLGSSFAVEVDGNNAYIAGSSSLLIFDISALNGAGPSELVRINDGSTSDFDKLSLIRDIDIVGNYAYVGSSGDDAVTIIDVSDPANPSFVSKLEDNVNGFNHLSGVFKIAVSGDYAFVSSLSENAVSVVNISDPFNPQLVTVIEDGVGGFDQLAGARDVSIANDLLYVTAFDDDALTIIDVSTPSVPVKLAELVDGVDGFDYLDAAFDVEVVGDYAFVTGRDDSAINIIDVSIPTSPTLVTAIRDGVNGFNRLSLASEMKIVDDIIYVTAQQDNALTLIDISDKQNPELIATVFDGNNGYNRLSVPYAVEVSGDFIYVTSVGDDTVTIIEQTIDAITVDLITQNRIGIGTSQPSAELHVDGDAFVTGSLLDSSQQAGTNGQILTTTGTGTEWTTLDVNDNDSDPTNELQMLTLNGSDLSIDDGHSNTGFSSVDLSSAVSSILDSSAGLGIGLSGNSPNAALQINGNTGYDVFQGLSNRAEIFDGSFASAPLGLARVIEVRGDYAYVVTDIGFMVFDVSDLGGVGPIEVARIEDGDSANFNSLASARGIELEGNYAYISSRSDNALTIVDVSDPTNPTFVSKLQDGVGGFDFLGGCYKAQFAGGLLYVTAFFDNAISIIDVSNPATPQLIGVIRDGVNGFDHLRLVTDVEVAGNLLYTTAISDHALSIIDISNPNSPQHVSSLVDGVGGFNYLMGAFDVEIAGDYAFVSAQADNALSIIDVSTPASPQLVSVIRDDVGGFNNLQGIRNVQVVNDFAYVVSAHDNALTIIDVSDKANPVLLGEAIDGLNGFNRLDELFGVNVVGDYIYVASASPNDQGVTIIEKAFNTIPVDLIAQNRIGIGTSQPSAELHVDGDAYVTGSLLDSSQQAGTSGQVLVSSGSGTAWTTLDVSDQDASSTNELQNLSLSGTTLSISNGTGVTLSAANIGAGTFADNGDISLQRGQKLNLQPWDGNNGLTSLNQFLSDGTTPSGLTFGNLPNIKNNTDDNPALANFNAVNQVLLTGHGGGILGTVSGGNETPALFWNSAGNVSVLNNLSLWNIESTLFLHSDNHQGRLAIYENGRRQFGSDTVTGPVLSHPLGGGLGIFPSGSAEPFLALRWGKRGDAVNQESWVSIPGELSVRGILRMRSSDGTDVFVAQEDKTVDILNLNVTGTATLPAGSMDGSTIADGSILTAKIADRSISASKIVQGHIFTALLAPKAVTADKIADGTITGNQIASNAINSARIANNSITTDDLANNSVDTLQLQNDAVTDQKLANNAVHSTNIQDGTINSNDLGIWAVATSNIALSAVSNNRLGNNAVTTDKIFNGTIITEDIAEDAIKTDQIEDSAVTAEKLADDYVSTESGAAGTRVLYGQTNGTNGTTNGTGYTIIKTTNTTGEYNIQWSESFTTSNSYSVTVTPITGQNDVRIVMITSKNVSNTIIKIRSPNGNPQNTAFNFTAIGK